MLFNRNIEPSCSYCDFGTALGVNEIACLKRGIMETFGSCGMFRYEPTKRVPGASPTLKVTELNEEDFSI